MKSVYYYDTPIGEIGIVGDEEVIYEISFYRKDYPIHQTYIIYKCYCQLMEYFKGERKDFDLPLFIEGTTFQKKVWYSLLKIPYGKVSTYKKIAISIHNEKAVRAVGHANRLNKLPILIPCHRVIGSNGKLVGYNGGIDKKEILLELERRYG